MDWKRIFTGVIIGVLFSFFLFIGDLFYSFIIILISLIALWEFYSLFKEEVSNNIKLSLYSLNFIFSILLMILVHTKGPMHLGLLLSFYFIVISFFSILLFKINHNIIFIAMKHFMGVIYISLSFSFLILMRKEDSAGVLGTLMIVSIVSAGDIGAYYIGTFWGLHKLCPSISPKKTIEGSLGGLFCSIFVAFLFKIYAFNIFPVFYFILLGLVLNIAGQIGDLLVSAFKRSAGVKDSGKILPGHGGILDRVDGLLLAIPISYYFFTIIIF